MWWTQARLPWQHDQSHWRRAFTKNKTPIHFGVMGVNFGVTGSILRNNSKSITAIKLNLGISYIASPWAPDESYSFWGHDLDFQGHRGHRCQIWFLEHNSIVFRATNLKHGTDTWLASGKMSIHFGVTGVTECKKVKIAPIGVSCSTLWCYIFVFGTISYYSIMCHLEVNTHKAHQFIFQKKISESSTSVNWYSQI